MFPYSTRSGCRSTWLPTLSLLLSATWCGCGGDDLASRPSLKVGTTTSARDSGILDQLLPPFEARQHVRVDVIAVGTGKALKLGEAGDVDVLLVHAREAEDAFMEAGHGTRREDVMENRFELLGPATDPAAIRGMDAPAAMQRIAAGRFSFVSRGDDSGTYKRELLLWKVSGTEPDWPKYIESGQGMGATLTIADELAAYVLTDRATWLNFRNKVDLVPLATQTAKLRNPYGVIVVNSKKKTNKGAAVRAEMANALVDYLTSRDAQKIIADFRLAGEALFVPLHLPAAD
ncbi:MAG: substrate-binding domain-containing protein [Pirellulales bacterium]|nr:substrate-binding domain-containing protein [Pirellulales bacterium]